jgi:hypothetical protein
MKNSIEDFINQNREAFDNKEPSDRVWTKINNQLFRNASFWNSITLWRAAAVVLLGLCIYLAVPKFVDRNEKSIALNEFKDIESFYISQIAEKVNQIEASRGQETGLNGFTHDFRQLDAMYEVLKEEMKTRPSQKVKDALVLNLLIRIDLLNQQLHKIDEGTDVTKEDTKVNT